MASDDQSVKIHGVGSHEIHIEALDHPTRERLTACIQKNGKISIMVGHGVSAATAHTSGFSQQID